MFMTLLGIVLIIYGTERLQIYLEVLADGRRVQGTLTDLSGSFTLENGKKYRLSNYRSQPIFTFSLEGKTFSLPYSFDASEAIYPLRLLQEKVRISFLDVLSKWLSNLCPKLEEGSQYTLMVDETYPEFYYLVGDYRVALWEAKWVILGTLLLLWAFLRWIF